MSKRGFSLLEVTVATALLALVLATTLTLLLTGSDTFNEGSVKQLGQVQAQRVLDAIADDFRSSAAWDYFRVTNVGSGGPGSGSGDTVTRLTKFYSSKHKTSGFTAASPSTPPGTGFAFLDGTGALLSPLAGSTDGVAFLRVRAQACATNVSTYPAYLLLDFEPVEAPGTWPANPADIGADGGTPADHQPGRMDDDPHRQYVLYRSRVVQGRIIVERVRGIAGIANDAADDPTGGSASGLQSGPQLVTQVGDLGPDAPFLPSSISPGFFAIDAIDTGSATGAGNIHIHVVARGLVRKGNGTDAVTADLQTTVSIPCAVPPF